MLRLATVVLGGAVFVFQGASVATQQSLPWTGAAADEARSVDTGAVGAASITAHALSADGRFVTFLANYPLLSSDTNGAADVYVRDRMTGEVERVSVASDGTEANANSHLSAISEDGRHVAFLSSASNLVADDTNGYQDVFVHDRVTHTTSLVSLGVSGEAALIAVYEGIRLSADGRFVTFLAVFGDWQTPWDLYLRDRDPDQNGVFDEPGLATTVKVLVPTVGNLETSYATDAAISADGRYIAYVTQTTEQGVYRGQRVFLHDRQQSTTTLVDAPLSGDGGDYTYAHSLDLAAGHLVYVSNLANLVEDDTDDFDDVFVHDIAAGTNSIVRLPAGAPHLGYKFGAGISTDGRYVTFSGSHPIEPYGFMSYSYAIDRQTAQTRELGLRPDGTSTGGVYFSAMSADGSAVAFWGWSEHLVYPTSNQGVYVETAVSVSPSETDIPEEGGTFTVEWTAPSNTSWTVDHPEWATVSPASGVGSATLTVTIDANTTGQTRVTTIAIGSEAAAFRQIEPIEMHYIAPPYGSLGGGEQVTVWGRGFTSQSSVTFGGVPAANVVFLDPNRLQVTTPPHAAGYVEVTVSDPGSPSSSLPDAFYYFDPTPPVISYNIVGTLGLEGWYTGDVTVTWTVDDPDSDVEVQDGCNEFVLTTDAQYEQTYCVASSQGGTSYEYVSINRDATAPAITIQQPEARTYVLNEVAALSYTCDDATSGIESCSPSQAGANLDTSSIGTFDFIVTATDVAGNQTIGTVAYTVKAASTVDAEPATRVYGTGITLVASLSSGGAPLAGRTIAFFIDDVPAGAAETSASGVASLDVGLVANAGAHTIRADYAGDEQTVASTDSAVLTIEQEVPTITWSPPTAIVYGTPLGASQLRARTQTEGTFSYSPAAGTVLNAGTHTLSTTFTPYDTTNVASATAAVSITVTKATPVITWNAPADITYGTAISSAQLNATANVLGVFAYTLPGGVVNAGTHELQALFQPLDGQNYHDVAVTRSLTVNPAPLTIQTTAASKVYGQALPAFSLSGTGFMYDDTVAYLFGTPAFSTSATAVSAPGTYPVTPSGVSSPNYTITFAAGTLTVTKADTTLTLTATPNPSRPNQTVQLRAAVAAAAPGAGTVTGSVEFRENGTLIGMATIVNGVATFNKSFKKGTHPITATYAGDLNFNGSAGNVTLTTN